MRDLAGRGQADGRDTPPAAVTPERRRERQPAARGGHPTPEQLEGVAYGWLAGATARHVRAHAVTCSTCGSRLAAEEELRRRLELLRGDDEPRVDVLAAVLRRLPPTRQASAPAAARLRERAPNRQPRSHERSSSACPDRQGPGRSIS